MSQSVDSLKQQLEWADADIERLSSRVQSEEVLLADTRLQLREARMRRESIQQEIDQRLGQ